MPLGLYLHIPFCSSICNYCNFNRSLFDAALKDRYVRAIEAEIRTTGKGEPADTIFFGGGTPSLLDPAEVRRLIVACHESFTMADGAEVTLETNPETSSLERMAAFREAGVNRISFGVQSFREEELRRLGRLHSADRAREALKEARAAGFDNVSLDLMMWLPQQTRGDWRESVEGLIDLEPDHASLYLLELYPNAPLKEDMARAGWSQAPDEDAAEMYLWSLERLEQKGYRQYRDLERRASRAGVAPQPEILVRRRMAGVRLWCALDPRRSPLEERIFHQRVHRPAREPRRGWWPVAGDEPGKRAPRDVAG